VIGDLMLDRYLLGDVQRISPEAPVPVILLKDTIERAGGAANVAANLALLGLNTSIIGCVGQDSEATTLLGICAELGINVDGVYQSSVRPTITKTRVLGGHQQMLRIDQEKTQNFSQVEIDALLLKILPKLIKGIDVVILSDYSKGVLSEAICQQVIVLAKSLNVPVLVDPKGRDYQKYRGATALTPNKKETSEACNVDANQTDILLVAAKSLKDNLNLDFLAVTRGEEGISLIDNSGFTHLSATAKQVFDVSGAGDTVISILAAGLIHGLSSNRALTLANIAAGIVVGKVGTEPITRDELLNELLALENNSQANKICDLNTLLKRVSEWRHKKQKIVFTNGCFDLLHAGHVTYLEAAKRSGDKLILGLNTDRSVSALKGPSRPVIHEQDRARVLAALEAVDAVILFDEETPLELIQATKADVIVKGSDYTEVQVVGGDEVKSWGGKVVLIDIVQGRSTSRIIEKMIA
jgi:D-beta-D-heptose 7-phosphate kinase/D-beta-D-heptose 1-phosphate adenosyltransferase